MFIDVLALCAEPLGDTCAFRAFGLTEGHQADYIAPGCPQVEVVHLGPTGLGRNGTLPVSREGGRSVQ